MRYSLLRSPLGDSTSDWLDALRGYELTDQCLGKVGMEFFCWTWWARPQQMLPVPRVATKRYTLHVTRWASGLVALPCARCPLSLSLSLSLSAPQQPTPKRDCKRELGLRTLEAHRPSLDFLEQRSREATRSALLLEGAGLEASAPCMLDAVYDGYRFETTYICIVSFSPWEIQQTAPENNENVPKELPSHTHASTVLCLGRALRSTAWPTLMLRNRPQPNPN